MSQNKGTYDQAALDIFVTELESLIARVRNIQKVMKKEDVPSIYADHEQKKVKGMAALTKWLSEADILAKGEAERAKQARAANAGK